MARLYGTRSAGRFTGSRDVVNATINFIKQDLPWAQRLDRVTLTASAGANTTGQTLDIVGGKHMLRMAGGSLTTPIGLFSDGSPAIFDRRQGQGLVRFCAFPLGLSYFVPAIPKRPVDRGTLDSSFNHFLPEDFEVAVLDGVVLSLPGVAHGRQALASQPLVDVHLLSASGIGTALVLVNWLPRPRRQLSVRVRMEAVAPFKHAALAGQGTLGVSSKDGWFTFLLDLDVADAIVLKTDDLEVLAGEKQIRGSGGSLEPPWASSYAPPCPA